MLSDSPQTPSLYVWVHQASPSCASLHLSVQDIWSYSYKIDLQRKAFCPKCTYLSQTLISTEGKLLQVLWSPHRWVLCAQWFVFFAQLSSVKIPAHLLSGSQIRISSWMIILCPRRWISCFWLTHTSLVELSSILQLIFFRMWCLAAALCAVSSKTFSFESKIFKDGRNNQFYCCYLPSTWSMYLLIEGFLWLFVFHIDPVEAAYYWRF